MAKSAYPSVVVGGDAAGSDADGWAWLLPDNGGLSLGGDLGGELGSDLRDRHSSQAEAANLNSGHSLE
ncbi:hypothetical protein GCM10017557_37490 [Streptomyces aurantiacus]|uniref:Uncharacterized protein n=1 Tax=Streptomyces aurantiacus TaxID=47760 RepID=A0A7G1P500_9ACTN|nr:hypothetical protein GCM10017557_37490 [Streptomyces aurantiacus]